MPAIGWPDASVSCTLIGTVEPAFHLLFGAGDSSGLIAYWTP